MTSKRRGITLAAVIGGAVLLAILVIGTLWNGRSAGTDADAAARSVSLLYLDELAGRREQVVAANMQAKIDVIQTALELMTDEDLSDGAHLQAYQARIKRLFKLERFAFVGADGLIYTATGPSAELDRYHLDFRTLTGPEISVENLESADKKVVIAVPTSIRFADTELVACFMQIDMKEMLAGVSMDAQEGGATYCNIYTNDGIALSNTVLGGLAVEDNLLEAMRKAEFEPGYSYDGFLRNFSGGVRGVVCFTYDGIRETLTYVPVSGTNWLLTYLIRESVISENISTISQGTLRRSLIQSVLTVAAMLVLFAFIIRQTRRNAQLTLEKETAAAESRILQEEMEQRLRLQEELLAQEKQQEQQAKLITALASDYWSVYYIELDRDQGICYQAHTGIDNGLHEGDAFPYLETFSAYARQYITEPYREEFLRFIQPDAVRRALGSERVVSYRYMVSRRGRESYEMVRFAGVRHPEDRDDHLVHSVGACFSNVDAETRKTLEQGLALSDALAAAEQANQAKTAFLSNMSHEIRTPMNAIIGLNSIALNDPETPEKTREYLKKADVSAQHLLGIINDILDMSRIESGRMVIKSEEFSFSKMLEQINTMISGQCRDKGLRYECRILGRVDDYYIGDDMKLRQVMLNILGNAVKFTPGGGTVTFVVEEAARYDGKSTLRFIVSDTGIGMSKEYLPRLFETFSQEDSSATNKYGSTGLGMPITKSIVELMNGTIDVESEKGVGTTFTVTVTLTDSERKASGEQAGELKAHEMCVLVIDDDPIACEHARIVLGQVGITCETAGSGAEALEMVRVHQARREPYNLILVDWRMPEMDGIETTRRIRQIVGRDAAIIILTSYNWDEVADEAKRAGVDTFVPKPLFAGTVLDEFRAALESKHTSAAGKAELKGRRVLLAEDVAVNAEIMRMVLQMREMEVDLAENGRIALEKFTAHDPGYYDAILMDMRMPEMGGLEATRAIRALDRADARAIPIIALTANAFDEDVQRSMQAGLNAHLSKPVEPQALFEALENLIPA